MKSSWALYVVVFIILLNVFAAVSSKIFKDDSDPVPMKIEDITQTKDDEQNVSKIEEEELDDLKETTGSISDIAPFVSKAIADRLSAKQKSLQNQELMIQTGRWIATDYVEGDIQDSTYTVERGDTLWEIAEGFYGDGARWREILNLNIDQVGYLPNGQQAKIIPGQVLILK